MRRLPIWDILAIIIIVIGIGIRLSRLDIPFDPEDVHLDYLAAHHMVRYGEIPWSGSGNPILIDSPLYYYIVAFFVRIYDSLFFLAVANITVIQGITFALMYRIASVLFNRRSGVLTLLFAVFSHEYIAQGAYFFQTHVMQVFANGALLFLLLFHERKHIRFAYASILSFVAALTIHHSLLALAPLYAVFLFAGIRSKNKGRTAAALIGVALGVFVFFHIPIAMLIWKDPSVGERIAGTFAAGFVGSFAEFGEKLARNAAQFVYAFSLRWVKEAATVNGILAGTLVGSFVLFLRHNKHDKRMMRLVAAVFALIIQLVVIASLLRTGVWNFTFSSLFGLYLAVVSAAIVRWLEGSRTERAIGWGIVLLTLYAFSNGFSFMIPSQYPPFYRWNITKDSLAAVARTVQEVRVAEKRSDVSFFRIERVHKKPEGGFYVDVYSKNRIQVIEDILYWPQLENMFATRFVRMEKDGTFPTILNGDDFVFVICDSTRAPFAGVNDCITRYLTEKPQYSYERIIYERYPITIFLVRRNGKDLAAVKI